MMRTAPCRRTILQCSHRTLTDGLTFMLVTSYLNRYVIRPRVRSYGDSSTLTLSPGRIRMKFIRILPDTWASTLWPLSSSTRNIALGSGSTTVPSTSIASSLVIPPPSYPRLGEARQHVRPVLGDRDGVLEVRRPAPVLGDRRPVVGQDLHLPRAHRHHRLDGQHHAGLHDLAGARVAEVRHLRVFVKRPPDAVAHERPDHAESMALAVRLDGVADVAEPVARPALHDGLVEALARHVEELLHARGHRAHRQRDRAVRVVALDDAAQ